MAQYLVLIYESEDAYAQASPEDLQRVHAAHGRFAERWGSAILGGNALEASSTATTVRGDVVTDGPFVESKEMLGGYYLVEARDLDEALAIGRSCPAAYGGVEVRPVMDLG